MKILHLMSAFDIDFPGGITNYLRTLAASQIVAGDDVYVIDGSAAPGWKLHPLGFKVMGTSATAGDHFVLSMKQDRPGTDLLIELVSELDPEVIHFHLTSGLGIDFYRRLAESGVKYVVSLHDYYLFCPRVTMMNSAGENCGGPEKSKCERCIGVLDQVDPLFRISRKVGLPLPRVRSSAVTARNQEIEFFLRQASALLAVSARVKELYKTMYPDANYVVSHIGSSSANVKRAEKTPSERLRLTFIGTLAKFKGAELLERIAQDLSSDDFVIQFFGRFDRPGVGRAAIAAGVEMHGPYVPADLPEIMSITDVGLVLPIWEDNAPQVVMEFLNYGVPVIATRMGGIPDFVSETNGFLFDPNNDHEYAAMLNFLQGLDLNEVRRWGLSLPRLSLPADHQAEVQALYGGITA